MRNILSQVVAFVRIHRHLLAVLLSELESRTVDTVLVLGGWGV